MPKRQAPRNLPLTQKIIVPKGTIDPSDDTIIEIPAGLHKQPVVIAKRTGCLPIFNEPKSCQSTCSTDLTNSRADISHILQRSKTLDSSCHSRSSQAQDLDTTEVEEKEVLLKQLEDYQRARRKFLVDATAVAGKSSSANVTSPSRSGLDCREKSLRWDTSATQTIPPPIPPRPIARDSIMVTREQMNKSRTSFREDPAIKFRESEPSCSVSCKNNPESEIDLEKRVEDLDSEASEEYGFDRFLPELNSTYTVKKKKVGSGCDTCCSKPFQESHKKSRSDCDSCSKPSQESYKKSESGCDSCCNKPSEERRRGHRRRRGDIPTEPKPKKKTMEKTPSRTSDASVGVSEKDSCLGDDCTHGSKKKDVSCAPCCDPKSSPSRSSMPDQDFERIKEQLREARMKLDEAVAMVSRTVASSSSASYASGKMTPESDTSSKASFAMGADKMPPAKSSSKTIKVHDLQKCPVLQDLIKESVRTQASKSKSTNDRPVCSNTCSHMEVPPCISKDVIRTEPSEERSLRRSENLNPPTISCCPSFPSEIPPAKSKPTPPPSADDMPAVQSSSRPISPPAVQSRPTSPPSAQSRPTSPPAVQSRLTSPPSAQSRPTSPPAVQSRPTSPPSAQSRPTSPPAVQSRPTSPPSAQSRPTSPPATSRKSMPTSSTTLDESLQRPSVRSKPSEDDGYEKFIEDEKGKTRNANFNVLCSTTCQNMDPPPCRSEEVLKRKAEELQLSLRKLTECIQSSLLSCKPSVSCDEPSASSVQESARPSSPLIKNAPASSTKIEESRRRSDAAPKADEDSQYVRFRENVEKAPSATVDAVYKDSQTKSPDVNKDPCTNVCLNMDDPPVGQSDDVRSKELEVPRTSRRSTSVPDQPPSVACTPTFPCDIPPTPKKQVTVCSSVRASKSLPNPHTSLEDTERTVTYDDKATEESKDSAEDVSAKPDATQTDDEPSRKSSKVNEDTDQNLHVKKTSFKQPTEQGGIIVLISTSTQTQTEKSVTMLGYNIEDQNALPQQADKALSNEADVEETVTKTSTVKFKKNKK